MADVGFVNWLGEALGKSKSGEALQHATTWTFIASGIASLVLAAFSLTLPHTPPRPVKAGESQFAWLEAMKLLAVPFVLVLFVVTFVDAAVHQCYFIWTNDYLKSVGIPANWVMPVMSIGQIAEIGTMAVLGLVLKNLGWRTTMVIGILGHALRFGAFAMLPMPWLAVSVNVLHGICYAFYFATVYIFVDEFFPKDARTSAQGLFNFLILGVGPFIANFIWPMVGDSVKTVDLSAQVKYAKGGPELVISGLVKNAKAGDSVELRHLPPGPADAEKSESKSSDADRMVTETVKLTDNKLNWEEENPAPGKHQFAFDIVRKHTLLGDAPETVKIAVEVPKAAPEKAPDAVITKVYDFEKLFLYPSGTALVAAVLLALFFRPPAMRVVDAEGKPLPH
jgi:hypothetical protein